LIAECRLPFIILQAWIERIAARPQVKAGLSVPEPQVVHKTKEDAEKAAEEARAWIFKDQQKK